MCFEISLIIFTSNLKTFFPSNNVTDIYALILAFQLGS